MANKEASEATARPWEVHEGEDYIVILGGEFDTTDNPIARVYESADADLIVRAVNSISPEAEDAEAVESTGGTWTVMLGSRRVPIAVGKRAAQEVASVINAALTTARHSVGAGDVWDEAIGIVCDGSTNRDRRTGHSDCWVRHQRYIVAALEAAKAHSVGEADKSSG